MMNFQSFLSHHWVLFALLVSMVSIGCGGSKNPAANEQEDVPIVFNTPDTYKDSDSTGPDVRDSHVDDDAVDTIGLDSEPETTTDRLTPGDELSTDDGSTSDDGTDADVLGPCAPNDANCVCERDDDCDQSFNQPCLVNRCDQGLCRLDTQPLEGQACDDDNACTTGDICQNGACVGTNFICQCQNDEECDNGNPCTDNFCRNGYCTWDYNTAPCDNGDPCTTNDFCSNGRCVEGDFICECRNDGQCNDNNPCTTDRCSLGHCQHDFNTARCDDGDPCTKNDTCSNGVCVPGEFICDCRVDSDCDDDNPCTNDSCVSGSCRYINNTNTCDDGDECTVNDKCINGVCTGTDTCECRKDEDCPGANPCYKATCQLATHTCVYQILTGPCDDGDVCTVGDYCENGVCVPGEDRCECRVATDCEKNPNPCLDTVCQSDYTCGTRPKTGPCDTGKPCTSGDYCSAGVCVAGQAICVDCGDGACFRPDENCLNCPADCGQCPPNETDCGNGFDDDADGLTDCLDPDCVGVAPCPQTSCDTVEGTLACGGQLTGQYNSVRRISGTGCGKNLGNYWSKVFSFTAPHTGTLKVQVTNTSNQTDKFNVFILGGICNAETCLALGCNGATECPNPWAQVTMIKGAQYFFVVGDDNPPESGRYSIQAICE